MDSKRCSFKSKLEETDFDENERPFKKARHVWEIKGNYHLKDDHVKPETPSNGECSKYINHKVSDINSNVSDFISVDNRNEQLCMPESAELSNLIEWAPLSLMNDSADRNYVMEKWQTWQFAMGFADNAINKVLEAAHSTPFDVDLIENWGNDCVVENKGILMAIQSHGLQSNATESSMRPPLTESALENYRNTQNELNKAESLDGCDFLDAAVLIAIQEKGLVSQNFV